MFSMFMFSWTFFSFMTHSGLKSKHLCALQLPTWCLCFCFFFICSFFYWCFRCTDDAIMWRMAEGRKMMKIKWNVRTKSKWTIQRLKHGRLMNTKRQSFVHCAYEWWKRFKRQENHIVPKVSEFYSGYLLMKMWYCWIKCTIFRLPNILYSLLMLILINNKILWNVWTRLHSSSVKKRELIECRHSVIARNVKWMSHTDHTFYIHIMLKNEDELNATDKGINW